MRATKKPTTAENPTSGAINNPISATFFYDAECGFCTKSADWLKDRASLNLSKLDSSQEQKSASFRDQYGKIHYGHKAIAAALGTSPRRRVRALSRIIKLSGPLGALIYKVVAKHRRSLGSSPTA